MRADPDHGLIIAEPAGTYANRTPIVVDCSLVAAALFNEANRDVAGRVLANHELFAPYLLDHELVNIAARKSRHGFTEDALTAIAGLVALPITRLPIDPGNQMRTALKYDLTGYDAAYLQLALDLQTRLATFDLELGTAAQRALS